MARTRAIALDVDGTLVTLRAGIGDLYSEALGECGVSISPDALSVAAAAAWSGFEDQYLNSAGGYATTTVREVLLWHEFVRRTLETCEAGLGSRQELLAAVYSFFALGKSRAVTPGALEACRLLAEAGVKVIAATNNDVRSKQLLDALGFSPFLAHVCTAGELGWKKPSAQFFQALSEVASVPIAEMLHVGNSRRLDVDAARRAGMPGILFSPEGDEGPDVISDLTSLAEICAQCGK